MKTLNLPRIALALLCAASFAAAGQGKGDNDADEQGPRMEHGPHGMEPGMDGPGMDTPMPPALADLNLTDAQKAKLKEQHDKNEEAFIDMRAGIQKAELRLRQALDAQPIDEAKLKSAREDLVKYQTQQIDFRISHMRFFLSILTPDQRKKFDAAMAEGPMMGKGMGKDKHHKEKRK